MTASAVSCTPATTVRRGEQMQPVKIISQNSLAEKYHKNA